jgi:hypothetical protein
VVTGTDDTVIPAVEAMTWLVTLALVYCRHGNDSLAIGKLNSEVAHSHGDGDRSLGSN